MAEEKKPGLLKRIFSFGLGKKKEEAASETGARTKKTEVRAGAKGKAKQAATEKKAAGAEAKKRAAEEIAEKARIAAEAKAAKKTAEKAAKDEQKRLVKEQQAAERKAAKARSAKETARAKQEEKAAEAEAVAAEKAAREQAKKEKAEQERLEKEQARVDTSAAREEEEAKPAPEPALLQEEEDKQDEEKREGWFKRLRKGLSRSSSALTENITAVFTKKKLDEETLQDLEDILIQADLGIETAMNVTDALSSQRYGKEVSDQEVREIMATEITRVLEPVAQPLELDLDYQPHVILVVGVNGSGKTTTIGKISQKLYNAGFSTLLVAGDTFRAAAIEQLQIWGERTFAPVISRKLGSDAAGLAYDAYIEAREQNLDVVLMDTAGRLQNKKELMDELEKIIRVLKKQDPQAPHTVLLTLDATTGQNALNQVEIFKDVAGVNGLVMTKLDGTARGGILVAISAKHKLPVYFVGVGEQVEDLEPFEADVFANAIAGLDNNAQN